ncbi:MAG TPA: hypothetical protein G4O02_15280 [Caldilineae bacterium]|nr:hypothetical protein [Caldilineae bacterium]
MSWEIVAGLAVTLVALYLLNDWISRHLQGIGLLATGREGGAIALAWLIFLPGIVLHELSHWLVARVLGLRPSRLRVWPERRGRSVRMGYVDFRSGGALRDSLVGLAPFITGCALLLWIATRVFDIEGLDGWREAALALWAGRGYPDAWLYIYLIFAISNGMMPSSSDREAWGTLLLYILLAIGGLYALDLLPALSPRHIALIFQGVQMLTYALGLAVLVDLPMAGVIGLIEWMLERLTGRSVVY